MEMTLKRFLKFFFLLSFTPMLAFSQARPTATRVLDFQAGGGFVADFPDYTRHKFYGYGAYADLDFAEHLGIEVEFRNASDTIIPGHERTYEAGARYFRTYGRLVPYAKGLYGRGQLEYPPYPAPFPMTKSAATLNYNFIAAGAGIDYSLTWKIRIRADLEYQHWFAKTTSPSPNDINGLPRGLTPIMYMGGVAYRFGGAPPYR